jgi:predicted GNAT family acetyltransferase
MSREVTRTADKFLIKLSPKDSAYIEYSLEGGRMHIDSTFTPDEYRGRGLAAELTEAAIKYAREKKFKIVPDCSYAKNYFEKHSKHRDVLASAQESKNRSSKDL